MGASVSSGFLWSVITLLSLLPAIGLVLSLIVHLSFKRLHEDLSALNQTLQLCASALHRIAGGNSTVEYLEREANR